MSESLLYDAIEMWHGHPDLYINNLEETLRIQMIQMFVISLKLN